MLTCQSWLCPSTVTSSPTKRAGSPPEKRAADPLLKTSSLRWPQSAIRVHLSQIPTLNASFNYPTKLTTPRDQSAKDLTSIRRDSCPILSRAYSLSQSQSSPNLGPAAARSKPITLKNPQVMPMAPSLRSSHQHQRICKQPEPTDVVI